MIWIILIPLISICIFVFNALYHFGNLWNHYFLNETGEENNTGPATSRNEDVREGIFSSVLRTCFYYFQVYLYPQNQTRHSNDFGTPTNRNRSSQTLFNHQDETTERAAEEVSSTTYPKSLYTDSEAVCNQIEDDHGTSTNRNLCSETVFNKHDETTKSTAFMSQKVSSVAYPKSLHTYSQTLSNQKDDFGTPSNRNLSSQTVLNLQDETTESTAFMSEKVSSVTYPKSLYTNSQAVSNLKKYEQKKRAIPSYSFNLNRNNKGINYKESKLEIIKPYEIENEPLSSRDFTNENVVGSEQTKTKSLFTTSSKNENEAFASEDINCMNLEESSISTQFASAQQDSEMEDQTHEFLGITNKDGKEIYNEIKADFKTFQTFFKQEGYMKDIDLHSQGSQNENSERSCYYYQTHPKQRIGGEENTSLLSKDIHIKNIGGFLNDSQTFETLQDLDKNRSLQSKSIPSKNLEVICNNSVSSAKKEQKRRNQILPHKTIHETNTRGQDGQFTSSILESSCASPESTEQDDGTEDESLSVKDVYNTNDEGHFNEQFINSILESSSAYPESMEQDDGTEDESLSVKDVYNTNDEGHLNETETVSSQKRVVIKNRNLPSRRPAFRRYFFNSTLLSKQKKAKQWGRTFAYKTGVSKQQKEKISREKSSKPTVSDQQKENLSSTEYASNPKDNQGGVGSFMCSLFEKQLYTDVNFTSKGSNKALLSAHRAVLAAKSEYFKDLLFGDLAKESEGMQMEVEMFAVPFGIFSSIVEWFYTGNIEFLEDYTVLEIYRAAKHYKILQLVNECRIYIESMEINEHNVCSTLQLCNTLQVNELKGRCVKYIEENVLSVINSAEFEKSPFDSVREICQLQCLRLKSEAELIQAILRWLKAQPNLTRNAMKDLERALLKCVRFLSLSTKEFTDVILKNPSLLTSEESLSILLYLSNPTPEGLEDLPEWCNRSQRTLLSNHERKDPGIEKPPPSYDLEVGKIKIQLKPPDLVQDFKELTSVLHMKCVKGMHQIKSVKFSFQPFESGGSMLADLKIIINVLPNGTKFRKFYSARKSELTFDFTRAVSVHEGQVLVVEVTAFARSSCNFFQFDEWSNDPRGDFDCFFISKPTEGRLYFISEVAYEPLAPRLNSLQ